MVVAAIIATAFTSCSSSDKEDEYIISNRDKQVADKEEQMGEPLMNGEKIVANKRGYIAEFVCDTNANIIEVNVEFTNVKDYKYKRNLKLHNYDGVNCLTSFKSTYSDNGIHDVYSFKENKTAEPQIVEYVIYDGATELGKILVMQKGSHDESTMKDIFDPTKKNTDLHLINK